MPPAKTSPDSAITANCTISAMTSSDKVIIAAILLVTMLSFSNRGVSAQACTTGVNVCVAAVTTNDEQLCRIAMSCIDALSSACSEQERKDGKDKLVEKGCSGSGIPIISAMSLFVAALLHVL